MNVLAVIAHPDDELLGCGGTLRKLANEGHHIFTCVLCANVAARSNRPELERLHEVAVASARMIGVAESLLYDFPNIEFNVIPHLSIVKAVEGAIVKYRPEIIFSHHPGDLNIDHRVAWEATMAASVLPQRVTRDLPLTLIKRIYLFEIPSSNGWAQPPFQAFQPNAYFDITTTIDDKMRAMRTFEGALKPHPHPHCEENLLALAQIRGAAVGFDYAEAFCLVRDLNA
jgi:N-acetylglucosamine malate deacetylase 1